MTLRTWLGIGTVLLTGGGWVAGAAAGPDLAPGQVLAPEVAGDQNQPAVAFDDARRHALVVLEDDGRGAVVGVPLRLEGAFGRVRLDLGRARTIADAAADDADDPAAAAAPGGWLVVWSEETPGLTDSVRAAFVDRHGRTRRGPLTLASGCPVRAPNLARAGLRGDVLVVWSQPLGATAAPGCNEGAGLKGLLVDRKLGAGPLRHLSPPGVTVEDPFPGFDWRRNHFLVAYEVAGGPGKGEIHALELGPDGTPVAPPLVVNPAESDDPVLAYDLRLGRFLVVYEDEAATPDRIDGRFVDLRTGFTTPPFPLSEGPDDVEDPALGAALDRFLVTWGSDGAAGTGVLGRWLDAAGHPLGDPLVLSLPGGSQDTPTDTHRNTACAFQPVCLTLWEEEAGAEAADVALRLDAAETEPPGRLGKRLEKTLKKLEKIARRDAHRSQRSKRGHDGADRDDRGDDDREDDDD